jgi:small-conductance mechanosensitive channel
LNRKPSKNDALEALDFIINVLKEHEKELDKLINELGVITEKISDKGESAEKIEHIEERLSLIQTQITELIKFLSPSSGELPTSVAETQARAQVQPQAEAPASQVSFAGGPPVIVRCKQWDDFKVLAFEADTISFLYKDTEKTFQADALKNGRVLTYNGAIVEGACLLKAWLAHELRIPETKVLEGVLALG